MASGVDNTPEAALAALLPDAAEAVALSSRPDATVVRVGASVLKVHAVETHEEELAARLAVADALRSVFLRPTSPAVLKGAGRLVSRWPLAEPLTPEEGLVPWEEAARVLARLHEVPAAAIDPHDRLPTAGGPAKLAAAVDHLRAAHETPASRQVLSAFEALPAAARAHASRAGLVHGDFHLGQLVRTPAGLRLIDVDELGRGDPAWDLARPAAWYAVGLLPGEVWSSFLLAYLAAGGVAVPASDPWSVLDGPAQAMVVLGAARAASRDAGADRFDDMDRALLGACGRIARAAGGERS